MADLRKLLAQVLPLPPVVVGLASAEHDRLSSFLKHHTVVEAPLVRGRSVWEAVSPDWTVVISPNIVGLDELPPKGDHVTLIPYSGAPLPATCFENVYRQTNDGWRKAHPPDLEAGAVFEARVRAAFRLSVELRQLRGVSVPYGEPTSPRFTFLTPAPSSDICKALTKIDGIFAETPRLGVLPAGAVIVSVRKDIRQPAIAELIDRLSNALRSSRNAAL